MNFLTQPNPNQGIYIHYRIVNRTVEKALVLYTVMITACDQITKNEDDSTTKHGLTREPVFKRTLSTPSINVTTFESIF
jgi:hypothetical protein